MGLVLYALFGREFDLSGMAERLLICAVAFVVVWGALLDIRDARNARKIASQSEMLEDAYTQLEDLNGTLRAQRHDFKNHLQVVFGLIEMGEYKEAQDYIERVYGDVQLVSRALKTASPAVNALLAAKAADCEERGIRMEVRIRSAWQGLALPGWEMCRVLGNLIDNAIDAMADPPCRKGGCSSKPAKTSTPLPSASSIPARASRPSACGTSSSAATPPRARAGAWDCPSSRRSWRKTAARSAFPRMKRAPPSAAACPNRAPNAPGA